MSGDGGEDGNHREWQNVRDGDQKSCRRIEIFLNQDCSSPPESDTMRRSVPLTSSLKNSRRHPR